MVSFKSIVAVAVAATTALATPLSLITNGTEAEAGLEKRGIQPGTGTHNGFFYSYWTDGAGNVDYNNGPRGSYSVTWRNVNNWVGGKGWKPGVARKVGYNSTWNNFNQNSYLALYGWTKNPLVEYYVVEAYGSYNPASQAQRRGTVESDGGVYDIYQTTRNNQPSIEGTSTFPQFWSVRKERHVSGNITVKNHFDAWTQSGLRLGNFDYMIMATEGYQSSGSANVEVWDIPA